ncbi:MAG: O-antigen ligase family protein [Verrucomicrobiota bacterium]
MPSPANRWNGWYPLLVGLFFGLAIWKFGNPVVLDRNITPPQTAGEWLQGPWPVSWAFPLAAAVVAAALPLARPSFVRHPARIPWPLVLIPAGWFAWQLVAETHSVDAPLSTLAVRHFALVLVFYLVGLLLLARQPGSRMLWVGLVAGLAVCLVRASNQRLVEFKGDREFLEEGQRTGWRQVPPATLDEFRRSGLLVRTNDTEVINPVILAKLQKARVYGTLVYPNALASLLLLLLPGALVVLWESGRDLRPAIRRGAVGLLGILGGACFYWTDSKAGWLVGVATGTAWLATRNPGHRYRLPAIGLALLMGLGWFGLRFASYFREGATSASARLDYWRAAVQTWRDQPIFGTGPGTFQRPYARLKSPEAEMARLTHNDYLEQFSDSGTPGGLLYLGWMGIAAWILLRRGIRDPAPANRALAWGLAAWFGHGWAEFTLYIPGLAWPAFTLLGWTLGSSVSQPSTKFNATENLHPES